MIKVLIIKEDAISFIKELSSAFESKLTIQHAKNGLDGLLQYRLTKPSIVVIDNRLPDMLGMSAAAIIKDSNCNHDSLVYLLTDTVAENMKADFIMSPETDINLFIAQLKHDIECKFLQKKMPDDWILAIDSQNGSLPVPIETEKFTVNYIFSAYNKLSGDGLYFWHTNDKLYGFIFDCVGHDLSSYGQVSSIWYGLKKQMKLLQMGVYKSLTEVMDEINSDLISLYDFTNIVSALVFYFDFSKDELKYCPAGIPFMIVKEMQRKLTPVLLTSSLLGYQIESEFVEHSVSLSNIEEIVFLSDGLSELLLNETEQDEKPEEAKHDDVSAIFINLLDKKKKEG